MKFIPFLVFLVHFCNHNVSTHKLQGLEATTGEEFPFLVLVVGELYGSGILISENLVISPASTVNGSSSVRLYLGSLWKHGSHRDHNTKRYTSTDITVHENFSKIKNDGIYVSDIALIRLPQAVTVASNIYPGTLISKEEEPELEQKIVTISGYQFGKDTLMHTETLRLLNEDTCSNFFGAQFVGCHTFCAEKSSDNSLVWGNAATWKGKIIGYVVRSYKCVLPNSACGSNTIILNLVHYLDWISEKGNISVEELTGKTQENLYAALKKIKTLEGTNKKTFGKLEQNITNVHKRVEDALKNLQEIKAEMSNARISETKNTEICRDEMNKMNVELKSIINKHLQEVSTEISNARTREAENNKKRGEEINEMKDELKSFINKHLQEVKTEISNARMIETQNDKSNREELNKMHVELKNGINECSSKFNSLEENINFLSNEIQSVNESVIQIRNFINGPIIN